MIFALVEIGSWLFYSILTLAFTLEFVFVGKEKVWPTIGIASLMAAIVLFFSNFNSIAFFKERWQDVLWGVGFYIVMACLWATWKWYRRSVQRGRLYANCIGKWTEENLSCDNSITSINDIPINKRMAFFIYLKDAFYSEANDESHGREYWNVYLNLGPLGQKSEEEILEVQKQVLKLVLSSPKQHKDRIACWMVAWPFSMLTSLIFDFLYDFFAWLRISLNGLFIAISRFGFGKYSKDFDSIKVDKE